MTLRLLLVVTAVFLLWSSIFVEAKTGLEKQVKPDDDSAVQERNTPPQIIGSWGGENLVMEITADGATVEYGCAHGRVIEKIVPDDQGKFSVKGIHLVERGGPTRQGGDQGEPATYVGTIEGSSMLLEVKLDKGNESVGTFRLEKGKRVRLRRCG